MDGLEPAGNDVLVVATTNRPEALDAALTRPGRLDLALYVPPPDLEGRLAALRVHARDVPLAADADLEDVARRTERFTGAELRGVVREAAMAALREDMNAAEVGRRHLESALAGRIQVSQTRISRDGGRSERHEETDQRDERRGDLAARPVRRVDEYARSAGVRVAPTAFVFNRRGDGRDETIFIRPRATTEWFQNQRRGERESS